MPARSAAPRCVGPSPQELDLEGALVSLQRFLLGRDGDFLAALAEQLDDALRAHGGRLAVDDATLARWVERATAPARAAAGGVDAAAERLTLHADAAGGAPMGRLTAAAAPDALRLALDLPPPLCFVLDARALGEYNEIFRLRLKIQLCALALQRLALALRGAAAARRRGAGRRGASAAHLPHELHSLHLFAHEARHFLNALGAHMGAEACDGAWGALRSALHARRDPTLAGLRAAHRRYLDAILHGCLLETRGAAGVHAVLHALLALVLQAEARASAELALGLSSAESCASMRVACETLREHTRFIAAAAHELAGSDRDSPLHVLLLRLDFSGPWVV